MAPKITPGGLRRPSWRPAAPNIVPRAPWSRRKMILKQPLELTNTSNKYDIVVNVVGGGQTGQAGAIRLAIARGLQDINKDLRDVLKTMQKLSGSSIKVSLGELFGGKTIRLQMVEESPEHIEPPAINRTLEKEA